MNSSNRSSRRHLPVMSPVRLIKSNGQISVGNVFKQNSSKKEGLVAGECTPIDSPFREVDRPIICSDAVGTSYECPKGYRSWGYDVVASGPFECAKRRMMCIRNVYPNDDDSVSKCCVGDTPGHMCDAGNCPTSKNCAARMRSYCDSSSNVFGERCQKWFGLKSQDRNDLMSKHCTAEMMESGACREFASKNHGAVDNAVIKWCTPGTIKNPGLNPQVVAYTAWKFRGGPKPVNTSFMADGIVDQLLESQMYAAIQSQPGTTFDEKVSSVLNTKVTYRDNSKDPLCSCITSPLNKLGERVAPPTCFDTSCQAGGYRTQTMKDISTKCPSVYDCRVNVAAVAGGVNENINVQQICGGPPPATGSGDDKDLLRQDEARAENVNAGPKVSVNVTPSFVDQLNKPFAPDLFGDMSLASFTILLFALLLISAILLRAWTDHLSAKASADAQMMQMEQNQANSVMDIQKQQQALEVQEEIRNQIGTLPRLGAAM